MRRRLMIPENLLAAITPEAPAAIINMKSMDPRPKEMDETLASRAKEIDRALLQAASSFCIMRLMGKQRSRQPHAIVARRR